jgi:photosystem II stability/assembly factor-like uncharacterized protein
MRNALHLIAVPAVVIGLTALSFDGVSAQARQTPAAAPAAAQAAAPPQAVPVPPPPPINESTDPSLKTFKWRSIGPASMAGRIDDIAVVEGTPSVYYVAYATGGIWKTVNNGTTFTPIFDTYETHSIGDLAVAPSNPNVIYVGTGEPNNRQSSSFGNGVYKSTDAGKTFTSVGLKETQSIGRVVVHPKNPDIVYVAAVGHLFGPNKERGLYKSIDGGKTWTNTNFVNEDTGFIDVVMDPKNPEILFATSYQRRRTPHGFNGGGPGSGLWKTTNGGKKWTRLTGNGLPDGGGLLGRIGIDICRTKPNVVYVQIEVGASPGTGANVGQDGKQAPAGGQFGGQGGGGRGAQAGAAGQTPAAETVDPKKSGVWRSDDGGKTWRVVSNTNDRPMYYSQIRVDPNNSEVVYLGGAPAFKTTDGGKTFKQIQNLAHSDHHAIWIDPKDSNHVLYGNDGGLDVSYDGGDTWDFVNTHAVGQFYAISADMRKPYFVCGGLQDNGSWCGPSAKRATVGILNHDWFRVGGGDGFYTQQDPTDWTVVYAESQDGAVNRLDLQTGRTTSIRPRAARAGGPSPEQVAQMAAQFGMAAPSTASNIVPDPPAGEQFRFFWNTPTVLSPHNPNIVWVGGNRLFKSLNRGDTWTMSADLTKNLSRFTSPIMGVAGDVPMASKHDGVGTTSVITTVAESPVVPGVVWAGTNDGNLQVSRDGGTTFTNVYDNIKGVPAGAHVTRVEPSHFDGGTCYVSIDAHRTDDHAPYLYITKDYGKTWASIAGNLPVGHISVVREDLKNRNLLFVGNEYGIQVSLDAGKSWKPFMTGLPVVPINDILIHPRDNDLIIGTHGRSIWIVDDITALQQLTDAAKNADAMLLAPRPGVLWRTDITQAVTVGGNKHFRGDNPATGTWISYHLKAAAAAPVKLTIADVTGKVVREFADAPKDAGLNRVFWNLRGTPPAGGQGGRGGAGGGAGAGGGGGFGGRGGQGGAALEAGTYLVKLTVNGKDYTTKVVIEADPS